MAKCACGSGQKQGFCLCYTGAAPEKKLKRGGKGPNVASVMRGRGWVVKSTRLPDKLVNTGDYIKRGQVICGVCGSYKYDDGQCRNVKCKSRG